jgi:hypothetical protein
MEMKTEPENEKTGKGEKIDIDMKDPQNNKVEPDKNNQKNLFTILKDFLKDLITTFPELLESLDDNLMIIYNSEQLSDDNKIYDMENDSDNTTNVSDTENVENVENEEKISNKCKLAVQDVKQHIMSVIPERFFDILYEDNKMFEKDVNLTLLPNIDFGKLWKENITENTRKTIWKYLQLILFSTISEISNKNTFGETSKMFDNIGEEALNEKLHDTINNMKSMFSNNDNNNMFTDSSINIDNMPDAENIHKHINSMMDGKLGKLAKEIAEETAKDLNLNSDNVNSINDVFEQMLKNPTNLMNMVKNVSSKLDGKLKSGDIKESELLSEANDIMKNMKNIPGMGNMQDMLSKLGINPNNLNSSAMQNKMNQHKKKSEMQDNMKSKINNLKNNTTSNEEIKEQQNTIEKQMKEADKMLKKILNDLGDSSSTNNKKKKQNNKKKKAKKQ